MAEPLNLAGCWAEAVLALERLPDSTLTLILTADVAKIRRLPDTELRRICAFALTAIGEAIYIASTLADENACPNCGGDGVDLEELNAGCKTCDGSGEV
jgi:uncharacterized protein YjeT (DUF2065 family)